MGDLPLPLPCSASMEVLHLQLDYITMRMMKDVFTVIYLGGSYEKLVYGWQRSWGLRARD
jgi:hypothetical protein